MELDELKLLLNARQDKQVVEKSVTEIRAMLHKKTQSVLGKISRSIRIELIASLAFTIILLVFGMTTSYDSLRIYFIIFSALCFLFSPVLWLLLKKVEVLSQQTLPVRHNLEQIYQVLRKYVRVYFQLTMALIPVAMILAGWLGYHDQLIIDQQTHNAGLLFKSDASKYLILLVIYIVLFSVGMYFFTKWYLKKLYGNYLEQLQNLIKELRD